MIGKLVWQALLNKPNMPVSSKKRRAIAFSWDLLTSYVRALTQTYIKVAKFLSVFARVVQRGVLEVSEFSDGISILIHLQK